MQAIAGEADGNLAYSFNPTSVDGPEAVEGYIEFESDGLPKIVNAHDLVTVLEKHETDSRIKVQLNPKTVTQDSLRVRYDERYYYIPLLTAPPFYIAHTLLNGDPQRAVSTLEEYYKEGRNVWEFRNDCRDTLCFQAFADVLNRLAGVSNDAGHVQFRSALGYFAKRILDDGPQRIQSFNSLQQRVAYWNSCDNLKETSLAEVVAEKIGRTSYRDGLSTEREELDRIGYDPIEFDAEWSTVAPAAWLSHVLVTQDIVRAKEFIKQRAKPPDEEYEDLRQCAFEANYRTRSQKWGQVLPFSITSNNGDFRSDAFQYLKWSARDCRTKGKFTPLLFKGALAVLSRQDESKSEQQIRTSRHIAIGHNWRRDSATDREIESFSIAKQLARGTGERTYSFNSRLFVDAEASLIHAFAKSLDERSRQKNVYQAGLTKIRRLVDEYSLDHIGSEKIEFLEKELNSLQ